MRNMEGRVLAIAVKRGITLMERDKWEAALREAEADLPWHARRANVLVEGADLQGRL